MDAPSRILHLRRRMPPPVYGEDAVVHALCAQLDRGHAVFLEQCKDIITDRIGPGRNPNPGKAAFLDKRRRRFQKGNHIAPLNRRKAPAKEGDLRLSCTGDTLHSCKGRCTHIVRRRLGLLPGDASLVAKAALVRAAVVGHKQGNIGVSQ